MRLMAAIVAVLLATPALGQEASRPAARTNIGELMLFCKAAVASTESGLRPTPDAGFCIGYLRGMADMNSIADIGGICTPQEVGTNQLARIYVKWADDNPERHHEDMSIGWVSAMRKAFPCALK